MLKSSPSLIAYYLKCNILAFWEVTLGETVASTAFFTKSTVAPAEENTKHHYTGVDMFIFDAAIVSDS